MPNLPGWVLVWNDEFDVPGLPDASKWDYDTEYNQRGWWNNELQYYSRNREDNARVADGKLHITARRQRLSTAWDFGGQNYTSARLITRGKASWTYGRFEIRAKLPCTLGTWPAIWTLGTGGVWPDDGEIDIMEQNGFSNADKQQVLGTLHMRGAFGGSGPSAVRSLPNACTDFNIYHMTWDANRIVIGVNGSDYQSYANPHNGQYAQWPFDRPQYLLLNVAIGGTLGGWVDDSRLPASMEVDFVRVYRRQ
ncbi:glycoside hydrolase family 16 protein [Limnohabitans lacus]|uniref:glycoside hydrolase family 16 protein n=1 Tax=Limnohabitans lacus TaxID=3045173 RepID=UPI0024B50AAD|nr:glycoside hydrolase family 16 protein [Limnohabitans sp. HM2-2]